MIHEIEEVRVYCGPAALMAVSGKRLPEVRAVVNEIRGRKPTQGVMGLYQWELAQALRRLGVSFRTWASKDRPTLRKFIGELTPDTVYIINITGHYVTYFNGTIIDNHYRFGTSIDECRWARKRVQQWWRIE